LQVSLYGKGSHSGLSSHSSSTPWIPVFILIHAMETPFDKGQSKGRMTGAAASSSENQLHDDA
jgi:hypothetical protein